MRTFEREQFHSFRNVRNTISYILTISQKSKSKLCTLHRNVTILLIKEVRDFIVQKFRLRTSQYEINNLRTFCVQFASVGTLAEFPNFENVKHSIKFGDVFTHYWFLHPIYHSVLIHKKRNVTFTSCVHFRFAYKLVGLKWGWVLYDTQYVQN